MDYDESFDIAASCVKFIIHWITIYYLIFWCNDDLERISTVRIFLELEHLIWQYIYSKSALKAAILQTKLKVWNVCCVTLDSFQLYSMLIRCCKKFFTCVQIFNHKSDSHEDIHLAHIGPKIRPPEPLTDQRIAIVF